MADSIVAEHGDSSDEVGFGAHLATALVLFVAGAGALIAWHVESPILHTILDTSVFLTGTLVALLLWDIANRTGQSLPSFLAVAFAILAAEELLHTLAALEWLSGAAQLGISEIQWRAGTWGPPAHTLAIGAGLALFLRNRPRRFVWLFAPGLVALAMVLFAIFLILPRYSAPGLLGITRPTLILVPVLWALVGYGYWRARAESELAHAMALTAVLLVLAHTFQLYSRAPNDPIAMAAHLGKFIGDAFLLLSLTRIGAAATARRLRAERALAALNRELENRVQDRTAGLTAEIARREETDRKLQTQLGRLDLLNRITRSVGERQDAKSIFQVVVRSLEEQLPADFISICTYDPVSVVLTVAHVGINSEALAQRLSMAEHMQIAIDENGLSRCVKGQLVYEPDIAGSDFPFPSRLAAAGLRSLVISPLMVEHDVFGVLIVARLQPDTFSSTDCEFLRQLSEHVALAAHQAQLHSRLQVAYEDLKQTQQAAMQQERLRALGQMASGIAHDINNAISPVALYTASLMESEPNLSERTRGYLETVKRVTNDVAATVARLREFYRAHDEQAKFARVDINDIVRQVADLTRARWSDIPMRRGVVIAMHQDLDPAAPAVEGIDHELREALTNLVFNAVDALPEGGDITIRTQAIDVRPGLQKRVRLDVIDNGAGMDEATRRRCVEPFFTTKGERGTGLGLAMVLGVAARHHADLEIDSTPGKGTTMRLEFAAAAASSEATPGVDALEELRPLRLLLIDDDPFVLDSMRVVLELDGHTIVEANNGTDGVATFRASIEGGERFDAVITDLGMPHMDGNQVARAIKGLSPSTPIILMTGWGRRLHAEAEEPTHVDCVLPKPPQLDDLRAALVRLV